MRITIFSPEEDIKEDGSVTFIHLKESPAPNDVYWCPNIYPILSCHELVGIMTGRFSTIEVEGWVVLEQCKKV